MKLVINISEEFYNVLVDESYDSIRNIPLEHMDLVQKIKNGKPLNTVLDEIREEIKTNKEKWWYGVNDDCFMKLSDVLEIIDKYRAERGGEE